MEGNEDKAGLRSSMDPATTTVATSRASSVVAGEAASIVATARSVEHSEGRSEREKNDDGGGPLRRSSELKDPAGRRSMEVERQRHGCEG